MKKAAIITLSVLGVLLLVAWIVPTFFRDKIIARVQQEINNRVNARVSFRPDAVRLSLLRHFPNLTIQTDSLTVVGLTPFANDTLLSTRSLDVSVNLLSAIGGDKITVNGLHLEQPRILVKILRDGRANYAIYNAVEASQPEQVDTSQAAFMVDVSEWSVKDGFIRYEDQSLPMSVRLAGVNHTGSGSLSADISDLKLKTAAERLTVRYGGTEYLTDKKLDADMGLRMNLPQSTYTFTDNRIQLNDLPIELAGSVATGVITPGVVTPADTSIRFDLTYRVPDSDFKSLLSLVPGIYSDRFRDIEAAGKVHFDGSVKGNYNQKQIPSFVLNLLVSNGRFKYPKLPSAVENIGVDLTISNPTDQLERTVVNLKKFVADLGNNPVRGRALVQGLTHSNIDADVTAKLNLQELTQLFPIDSLTLRGLYNVNLKAKGVYDKAAKRFPVVNALMQLQNGYVKSLKYPEPLDAIQAVATVTNQTGQLADTRVDIGNLQMRLAGEPFQVKGWVQNFNDYTYNLAAKGRLNLTTLSRIFPIEGTQLAGLIDADIQTQGRVSDAKAGRYDRLPASGTVQVANLTYKGESLPQGLSLRTARMNLVPGKLNVQQAEGKLGTSTFTANGTLSNYIPFALEENQPLKGTLNVQANRLNLNEWMTDDPQPKAKTASPSVIEVPKNIQFTLNADVDQVLYDEMPLNAVKGQVEVAEGAVQLKKVGFQSLGGQFVTNGLYDTKDIAKPRFSFDIDIANAEVQQAYQHLTLAKIVFPLAQYVFGRFSSKFAVNGILEPDMMPNLNTLTGSGLVELVQATLKNNPIAERIAQTTKLDDFRDPQFKDLLMKAEIKDGYVAIKPFDVKIKDYVVNISGSNSLEGSLNYILKLDVPTGKVGGQFANTFASLTGQALSGVDRAKLDFALGGTYKTPQVRFLASSTANQLKETIVQKVTKPLRDKALSQADSLRTKLERRQQETEQQQVKNELKQQGLKLLNKLTKSPKSTKDSTQ